MLDYLGDCFKISYITDFVHKFIVILSKYWVANVWWLTDLFRGG